VNLLGGSPIFGGPALAFTKTVFSIFYPETTSKIGNFTGKGIFRS
jgi:hypothetical protein